MHVHTIKGAFRNLVIKQIIVLVVVTSGGCPLFFLRHEIDPLQINKYRDIMNNSKFQPYRGRWKEETVA